jgi:HNH endonuclease/AP2 domain
MLRSTGESCAQKRQGEALTVERLKEVLHYDPETGVFTWVVKPSKRIRAGSVAGSLKEGYQRITIAGVDYRGHRLAWLYMTGEWPALEIDHRDTNKSNNRWDNLRLATRAQNAANVKSFKHNTSGIKGVSFDTHKQRWRACINRKGKKSHVGWFTRKEDAAAAYAAAAREHHGDFARVA